jgi:hypothetical protein
MHNAARLAVFGCQQAGREPSLELWLALAKQHFDDAVKDCNASREAARKEYESSISPPAPETCAECGLTHDLCGCMPF